MTVDRLTFTARLRLTSSTMRLWGVLTWSFFAPACGSATEGGVTVDASAFDASNSAAAEGRNDASTAPADVGADADWVAIPVDATITYDVGDSGAAEGGRAIDASTTAGDVGAYADSGRAPVDAAIISDDGDSATEAGMTIDASMAGDVGADADSDACSISASVYDRSCAIDSDCIAVVQGDVCTFFCPCHYSAAINVAAEQAYSAAIARLVPPRIPMDGAILGCSCGRNPSPICRAGMCELSGGGAQLDPCSGEGDASGGCFLSGATCDRNGPPDACPYADEVCCLF